MITIRHFQHYLLQLLLITSSIHANNELQNIQLDEDIIILGDFNAISQYNSLNSYNITSSSKSLNFYQLSNSNDSISILNNNSSDDLHGIPSLWQVIDDSSTIMVINNIPYIFNLTNSNPTFTKLNDWENNVNGIINTIYYDDIDELIYIGGSLSFNNTFGIIQYDLKSSFLSSLPFGGFNENSIINSISYFDNSDSIIFSGSFYSIGYPDLLNITYNSTESNTTIIRNSTSITDISQKINLNSNEISVTSGKNYENIICPTNQGNGWILPNDSTGSWSVILQNEIIPSKIRLYNSNSDINAVNTFRIITYPANGIMNMSYIDPLDFQIKYCDAFCPLSLLSTLKSSLSNSNITNNDYYTFINNNQTILQMTDTFQDFGFVNSIDVTSFTIQIMQFYGSYSELLGIELYNQGITVYANDTLNKQNSLCQTSDNYIINVNSETIGNVNWLENNIDSYLITNISTSDISNNNGIRYNIYLPVSGEYSILMYTNGCLLDNSCSYRGIVNVTLFDSFDNILSNNIIYQNNQYEKYDIIYTGNLELQSDSLPIYVEMVFHSSIENNDFTYFVANSIKLDYIQLELNEITGNITQNIEIEKSGIIEINGIFEYSLNNFSSLDIDYPIGNTSINLLGTKLNSNATINQVISNDTSLIIAGDFISNYGDGILNTNINITSNLTDQLVISDLNSIDDNIINGNISYLYGSTNEFLIIGDFHNFDGSAIYYSSNNSFNSFDILNSNNINSISGFIYNNTDYLFINSNDTSNSNIIDFTNDQYFQNTSNFAMYIASSLDTQDKNWEIDNYFENSYILGSIIMYDLASNNIVQINNNDLNSVNISNNGEFNSGIYIGNDEFIIGGSNIYLIKNGLSSELSENFNFDDNTIISSLMWYKSQLFFAINNTGTFHSTNINGLGYYNINSDTIVTLNDSFSGYISDLTIDPEFGTVIGVGNFTIGDCHSICTFGNDSDILTIDRTVDNVSGIITSLNYFNDYNVLIAGDFKTGDNDTYFGIYNTYHNTLTSYNQFSSKISGPVEKFLFGNERENNKTLDDIIIVMGSDYIGYFNESNWNLLSNGLELNNAEFTDISLLNISSDNSQSFYNSQVLLLTGKFNLTNYGLVSSAFWNGEYWLPYTITANDFDSEKAIAQSVIRTTSMFIYEGSFTSSTTSSKTSSTSSSSSTATHTNNGKNVNDFTDGQVTGVGCALAVGTMILLSGIGLIYYVFNDDKDDKLEGLKLTGEDRVVHAEKMKDVVPPQNVANMATI